MSKVILPIMLVSAVVGGAYFYANYRVEVRRAQDGQLESVRISPVPQVRAAAGPAAEGVSTAAPEASAKRARPIIRLATFNLGHLDESKLGNRQVNDVLLSVLPQFEAIAVQDIRAVNQGVVVRLLERINKTGREYDFAVAREVAQGELARYSAFLFDRAAIELDRSTVTLVEDSANRFRDKPLVAQFRTRGPDSAEAFTFKLINVHVDPENASRELDLLDDVYRAVRDDGHGEDDVILIGDFGTDDDPRERFGPGLDLVSAVTATSTTTIRGTRPVDHILFDPRATAEFTGRAAVLDMVREFDMTLREALEISEHLPVWAEFSIYEGGQAGHIAARPTTETR